MQGRNTDGCNRFGLTWNEMKRGHLLSSSEDTTVCYWCVCLFDLLEVIELMPFRDIQAFATEGPSLNPISVFKGHDTCVNVGLLLMGRSLVVFIDI